MNKLPAFHKARLETFGFRFYTPKEIKAFDWDWDTIGDYDFIFSHKGLCELSGQENYEDPMGAIPARYIDGQIVIEETDTSRRMSAPVGSIPLVSGILFEMYGSI